MSTPPNKFTYPISNIRVIDGDTIEADVDLGFRIRQRQVIRLAGIDAPELRSKDQAERDRARIAKLWLGIMTIGDETRPIHEVVMHSTGLDKYGRSLAVIWVNYGDGWGNANAWMVGDFFATPIK